MSNTVYKIKDVCSRFSSGESINASEICDCGNYPVYGGNGLRGFTDKFNFEGECAIIGRQGAYCGNVKHFSGKGFMTEHAIVAVGGKEHNTNFLAYKLSLMDLGKYAGQSAQPGVSVKTLSNIDIELPELSEQNNIARMLSNIDNKIDNNNSICFDLESMAKALYDYWFVQFDFPDENGKPYKSSRGKMVWNEELKREIPVGWEVVALKGLYKIDRGLSYSSKDIESGKGIPMLNLACVDTNRNYRDGELKYHNGKVRKSSLVKAGNLMIACTDLTRERDIIGCPILVPDDGLAYTYSMDMARISFLSTTLEELYMYMSLRTDFYHNYIKEWASGTNVLHLNLQGLDWYNICVPPEKMQKRFAATIRNIHSKKSQILMENRQLVSLRDFLLPLLMNGQVKV